MARQKKEQKPVTKSSSPNVNRRLPDNRLYALIIFLFSLTLYVNTLYNGYNLDDELVTQNHRVTSKGWNVLKFNFDAFNSVELKDSSFGQKLKYFMPVVLRVPYYQDNAGFKYEYRPMVFASFALEHALFAKKDIVNGAETETDLPQVSHAINILLYSLLCLLLFSVLLRIFSNYNILYSFIITMLFAAYPMHTEVVASIKNRDEIMALIFGLLSLKFALAYMDKNKLRSLILLLVFFVLGILSKPTTIIFALLTPLALVMFTNSGYRKLISLSCFLVLPAVFFSRLYSAVQQTELAVLLFIVISLFYYLKNREVFGGELKTALAGSYAYFFSGKNESTSITEQRADFGFLKNPFTIIALVSLSFFPVALSASGIYIYNSWLACIPLLLLAVLYVVVSDEKKVVLSTPLALVAMLAIVKFAPQSRLIEMGLIAFLGSLIFSGGKSLRIIGIVNYVVYAIVSVVALHSFHFLFIILFTGFWNRKLMPVTWVAVALSAAYFFKKVFGLMHGHGSPFDAFMVMPVIYVFVLLLWRNRQKLAVNLAAVTIPLFLVLYFTVIHRAVNTSAYYAVQRTYYRVNSIKAADPTPVQSIRPLKYLEYPLNNTDPLSLRLGTSMEVLGKYLKMALIPYPMSYYYGYSCIVPQNIYEALPLISLLVYMMLFATAIYFFRKMPVLSFSILFYLISVVVFSDFITPIPGMLGDRFLLIPSIGVCILLVYLAAYFLKEDFTSTNLTPRNVKLPVTALLSTVLVFYSGITFSRNFDWKDSLTLFRHDIGTVENSAQAQNLLAVHLFLTASHEKDPALQKQMMEEAIPHYKKALEIYPAFLNASYDLGRTYEALHRDDEAFAQYQATVKIDTTFVAPYFNMGAILHNKGRYAEAIPMYEKFLTQYPRQLEAYTNLSFAYFKLNDFANSIAVNKIAMQKTGDAFVPTVNIAKTYTVMNEPDSALYYWQMARTIKPNDPVINSNIEQLLARQKKAP